MNYSIEKICKIIDGNFLLKNSNELIENVFFDSRQLFSIDSSIFIALKGSVGRQNVHDFIYDLFQRGVRNFIVSQDVKLEALPGANVIKVADSLIALQQLARFHRLGFKKGFQVIGITGSNGKTIVKEWLFQLLNKKYEIVRSPKSYNSQIGVPMSVFEINKQHTLGIFEAGISQPNEMKNLQKIICPDIAILTNVGEAHSEGFQSLEQKIKEKILMFDESKLIIYCADEKLVDKIITKKIKTEFQKKEKNPIQIISWGKSKRAVLQIIKISKQANGSEIIANYKNKELNIFIPFTDDASIQNAITCWCVLLYLQLNETQIKKGMKLLQPISMRLELKKGINNCSIINDSYSADLSSLQIALDFLQHKNLTGTKSVILSDFFQTGLNNKLLYQKIALELIRHKVNRVIGIGVQITEWLNFKNQLTNEAIKVELFSSIENFIGHFREQKFKEETILVKGARVFQFEKIIQLLEQKSHQTSLEINLNAVTNNFKNFQNLLFPKTKIMAMLKAFAYGMGEVEIATVLKYNQIDYFGVAYADEGLELRKAGILTPIMVMNPEENAFESIIENKLEPVIYSFEMLTSFQKYLKKVGINNYPIHIEIETGMNRLGISINEIEKFCKVIKIEKIVKVKSIYSHLAFSENKLGDKFTIQQKNKFLTAALQVEQKVGHHILKHLSNSAAIIRHPALQLDMVRLGIGLYGVNNSDDKKLNLETVATLKSTIAQIKELKKGETVGYGRKGILRRNSKIATVRIGYADGYSRRFGNGIGKMWVNGKLAPVIGMVCMDMTMIDITDIPEVKVQDQVIVFGKELPIQKIANWINAIPYEIMTWISQRVKRVYFQE